MKMYLGRLAFLLSVALSFTTSAETANLVINPSTVSNTYAGPVALQVTGITNGETVVVQKYIDANANGVVDAGDILWQQFTLTDGQASVFTNGATLVTNLSVPGDTDSTAGQITASFSLPVSGFEQGIVGNYLYVLSSPYGNFAPVTNSFTVTNFSFGQAFSGTIMNNGTNVPDAAVLLFQPTGNNNVIPQGGTVSDASGNYQISAPPGFYVLVAFKSNFVANTGAASATLASGVNISTNLGLIEADRMISGSLIDASNSAIGLAGVLVPVMSKHDLTVAFTDTNGNFSAGVTSDQWQVQSSDQAIGIRGYLRSQDKTNIDATSGSVSGVNLAFVKANALFYGKVTDGSGNPMPGTSMFSSENNNNNNNSAFEQNSLTYTNGKYFAGALSETNGWQVEVSSDKALPNYIYSMPSFDLNGGTNLSVGQAVQADIVALLATNTISGHVQDTNNNPITNVQVFAYATISGVNFQAQVNTDGSGNYSLNVANGNWTVSVDCQGGNNSLDQYFGLGNYQCPNGTNVNINNNNGVVNFTIYPCNGLQIYTTSPLPNGQVGVYYNNQLSGSSCSGNPVNWSLFSGNLPPGLNLYTGGPLNGTPTTNGTFSFVAQANDGNGHTTNVNYSLTINPAAAPPTLTQVSKSGNQFQFVVNASQGRNYTVQVSTNLNSTNWLSILVTNPTMNSFFISDPNATNRARFYRVLVGP